MLLGALIAGLQVCPPPPPWYRLTLCWRRQPLLGVCELRRRVLCAHPRLPVVHQTSKDLRNSTALHVIDVLILLVFMAEAVLRIAADWPEYHKYFDDPWNRFDFVIVVPLPT